MKEEKNILLITYYWPPSGGAGVQRWLKMLKYLSQTDVKCTVLTVDPKYASYPIKDESLGSDVLPNVSVFKTKTREPLNAYKMITKSKESPYAGFANESNPSKLKKLARWIRANFFVPDARKGWNKFAYRKAVELIKSENFDAIITTSPPHSTQLVGLKIKKNFPSIHWIADIRDPWTDIYYNTLFPKTKWAEKKDQNYEKSVLEAADDVIVVSQSIKELFAAKGTFEQTNFHVLANGYDHEDFNISSANASNKPDTLRIAYTGTLSGQYPIDSIVKAIRESDANIELHLAGKIAQDELDQLKEFNTHIKGYIPHNESILELENADVLLLIIPQIENNNGILTGKLFEYLGSQTPIILIGPPKGDAAKIVHTCESGRVFDYTEAQEMQAYLNELALLKSKNLPLHSPKLEEIEKYSRKNLARSVRSLLK